MPRIARELSALAVSHLKEPGLHAVGGAAGLHLQVTDQGARSWVMRVMICKARREMGLGSYPTISLVTARDKARRVREQIDQGLDPIAERRRARTAILVAAATNRTFGECAAGFVAAKSAEWRNLKHCQQWTASLESYAFPVIGQLPVRDITLPHVLKILEPIWTTKTETASRLRGRIEAVLDWAAVRGYRQGGNPARWRGHLDKLLPSPGKVQRVEHHEALAIDDMPGFMAILQVQQGFGAKALELAILTAARSGEVRGATWDEIDFREQAWTVPAHRMKAGKPHRVPLSSAATALLEALPRMAGTNLLFPSDKGTPLSDMALLSVLRRMGVDAVPHGFRSTFKDWASERTTYPPEMSEMALAHTIGDKVEAAYRRGDMFDKRRQMMTDWAAFCGHIGLGRACKPLRAKISLDGPVGIISR